MNHDQYAINYHFEEILSIILAFNTNADYDVLLGIILTKLMDITNSDGGTVYLVKDDQLHFRIVKNISLGINQSMKDVSTWPPISLDPSNKENASAYAALQKKMVIVNDVYTDSRFNFDGPKNYDKMSGYLTKSMLIMPLTTFSDTEPKLLGVLQLINAQSAETGEIMSYSDVIDESILTAVSNIATAILSNYLHIQETNKMFNSLVDITMQAIAERSAYSKNHTQNVSLYCHKFAKFLNERFKPGDKYYFTESEIETLSLAALLHDMGKIITPLEVMDKADRLGQRIHDIRYRFVIKEQQVKIDYLEGKMSQVEYEELIEFLDHSLGLIESINNAGSITDDQIAEVRAIALLTCNTGKGDPIQLLSSEDLDALCIRYGTLTQTERAIMQDHVVVTGRFLDKLAFPERNKNAAIWARNHHEFLNGTGYPNGLKDDELDKGSRILTIADIFDALVSKDRPYKKSIPVEKSLDILAEMSSEGKLDWELVKLFAESKAWEDDE